MNYSPSCNVIPSLDSLYEHYCSRHGGHFNTVCPMDGHNEPLTAAATQEEADAALLADLQAGERASIPNRPCQACVALENLSDQARPAVERALAGTIGETKLAQILTANGYPTGARAINRHRREDHQAP